MDHAPRERYILYQVVWHISFVRYIEDHVLVRANVHARKDASHGGGTASRLEVPSRLVHHRVREAASIGSSASCSKLRYIAVLCAIGLDTRQNVSAAPHVEIAGAKARLLAPN